MGTSEETSTRESISFEYQLQIPGYPVLILARRDEREQKSWTKREEEKKCRRRSLSYRPWGCGEIYCQKWPKRRRARARVDASARGKRIRGKYDTRNKKRRHVEDGVEATNERGN